MTPEVTGFFDARTCTISFVVRDPDSDTCAIIDPVLDYDPRAGRVFTESADRVAAFVRERGYQVAWILETHIHADHLSGAQHLKDVFGAPVAAGSGVTGVQETWKEIYGLGDEVPADGSQFDRLFAEGDRFEIGTLVAEVWQTPGHTPACVSYLVGDAIFVGDTMFMHDYGTARCDFPGGDARVLYRSIQRILSLPPKTRVFVCHDYQPDGREVAFESTVAAQRAQNPHVNNGVSEEDFIALREGRDAGLAPPELLLPALQVNIRAGHLPAADPGGTTYLKIPLGRF
ncbi:MAG: MBL fold metallo-hydrolase [Alphaproteobacteria bacterium]|nr:MBL fold metallo-hydrolase [Alphaproteobacteria bacterium]